MTKTGGMKKLLAILKHGKILDMKTSKRLGRLHESPNQRGLKLVNDDERN
jgi:hypothetical protein